MKSAYRLYTEDRIVILGAPLALVLLKSLHLGRVSGKLTVPNKMDINPTCLLCNGDFEDCGHLFFKFKLVKQVWRECGLEEQRVIPWLQCKLMLER